MITVLFKVLHRDGRVWTCDEIADYVKTHTTGLVPFDDDDCTELFTFKLGKYGQLYLSDGLRDYVVPRDGDFVVRIDKRFAQGLFEENDWIDEEIEEREKNEIQQESFGRQNETLQMD